ncbi:hypothetical protein Poli38472_011587 [Pythium oligandrum]|uniref:Rab-GAP TBC domain-containing protein n=1 Tax=Pythium oligandrum TaxID=41045 RepID=A0A8K1CLV7_PYTOL|nr:hypothetical protein Poli38472_011587 [Pythium oligandrum]|eukprot:TMW64707.1 hypothetical protein Poli38472_011587 [Pythium oligandrum]
MGRQRQTGGAKRTARTAIHPRSERERRVIDNKQKQVRALALRLRSLNAATPDDQVDELFQELRELAFAPFGFVSNELRQSIWPVLLGFHGVKTVHVEHEAHYTRGNAEHRDDQQIEKDILRSLWHYDVVSNIRESERRAKRRQLTHMINAVLNQDPELYYYQGYHDVSAVFLLVLGDQLAFHALKAVSGTYQREVMRKSFAMTMHATRLLFPILEAEDEELFAHIQQSGVEPFFALPWMITWFAHELKRFSDIARIYDVLVLSHPLFVLYLGAAVVLESRQRVLKTECDFGTLHGFLAKLPRTMDVEKVIAKAAVVFHRIPPKELLAHDQCSEELRTSMYAQFPFPYQSRFHPIDQPFLRPKQYQNRKVHFSTDTKGGSTGAWQLATVLQATAVGLMAVALSYYFRHHVQEWLPVLTSRDTTSE